MDINHILSLPPDERDLEIRKLIVPKPWEHGKLSSILPEYSYLCNKCGENLRTGKNKDDPCPVPDPIALDWNLAMKMRDEVIGRAKVGTVKYHKAMIKLSPYQDQANTGFWGIIYAQPHHYILAALEAGGG